MCLFSSLRVCADKVWLAKKRRSHVGGSSSCYPASFKNESEVRHWSAARRGPLRKARSPNRSAQRYSNTCATKIMRCSKQLPWICLLRFTFSKGHINTAFPSLTSKHPRAGARLPPHPHLTYSLLAIQSICNSDDDKAWQVLIRAVGGHASSLLLI